MLAVILHASHPFTALFSLIIISHLSLSSLTPALPSHQHCHLLSLIPNHTMCPGIIPSPSMLPLKIMLLTCSPYSIHFCLCKYPAPAMLPSLSHIPFPPTRLSPLVSLLSHPNTHTHTHGFIFLYLSPGTTVSLILFVVTLLERVFYTNSFQSQFPFSPNQVLVPHQNCQ